MDGEDRNMDENQNDAVEGAVGGHEDDDFGEFERFEGGIEHLQAQPAPSPWATFPDLLPVQTSPATPSEDHQSSSRNNAVNAREVWHPAAASANWGGPSNLDEPRSLPQPVRTLNPPDVSLGTNQIVSGRVTPDNVHDVAHPGLMNHVGGLVVDARLPVAQLDLLQQQLGNAEQSRVVLEEQVDELRQRNVELEAEVANSQAQINELQMQLQQSQENLELRLSEIRNLNTGDIQNGFRQLQEEISNIRNAQATERNEIEVSRQELEQMKSEMNNKFQSLESNFLQEFAQLEQRLTSKFGEECHKIRSTIESIVQNSVQQFSAMFSQIVMETLHKNMETGQQNCLMEQIKEELVRHEEQQKKALEEERRRQLSTVSTALQSALQHITGVINNSPQASKGDST